MATGQANRLVPKQSARMNASLSSAIRVLRFDATGLTRYLEEQAAENPFVTLQTYIPPARDWAFKWRSAFATSGDRGDLSEFVASPAPGLMAHVTIEAERLFPPGAQRQAAGGFLLALEPSGWLGRPLEDLATEAGISVPKAKTILARLQQMEPTGLFARSLSECLRLQAAEAGLLDNTMQSVLNHLDLLASGDTARLAAICHTDEAQVLVRLRQIRGFDPKPGSRFGQGAAPIREPDLSVQRLGEAWAITLNRSALPEVLVGKPGDQATEADRSLAASAKALGQLMASRNKTLLVIANAVLTRQPDLLEQGMEHLRPMTMADIAADLGYHESTISRAIAGVSLDAPLGVLWLRSLFSTPPKESSGPPAAALRAKLARLVAGEDAQKPYSDQRLSDLLSTPDAPLARRTVAKYRDMLNIAPAHRRKFKLTAKAKPPK
jgi:RNA polymerase sigma-54 factor